MAANNKNNYKRNSEVTMFRGVRLLVEASRAEGRFFYVEARIHIFMLIKKYSRFISERGAPDKDALMHCR